MTAKRGDGPTGWVGIPKSKETIEAERDAERWLKTAQPLLAPVLDCIVREAEARNGDALLYWHTTLSGLVGELAHLLSAAPAVVVKDREKTQ